jgi:hypothetical protein
MTTPIADEVARMHPDARSGNESDNSFSREQAMLAAAGAPTGIAVLVLYRGAWCPTATSP